MSEGVILHGRPLGPGVEVGEDGVGEPGGKCKSGTRAAARLRGRLSAGKLRQLPTSFYPFWPCLPSLWRKRRVTSDLNSMKFGFP